MNKDYQATVRATVRSAYDLQKLRIHAGNRLCANFRAKLGIESGTKPDDDDTIKVLTDLTRRYKLITDGVVALNRKRSFDYDGVITNYAELGLIRHYLDLCAEEAKLFASLGRVLRDVPIFTEFLEGVAGVGPAMAGVIVSEIDITKAEYPSSLWKYAGVDVAGDGRGRSRRGEHLVDVDYINAAGDAATRKSITFNPFLKTKLTGVLSGSFLRVQESPYKDAYYDYKHRMENSPRHEDKTPMHRHRMALRYMIKLFLADLYNAWRPLEGLPVAPRYSEEKLGIIHHKA